MEIHFGDSLTWAAEGGPIVIVALCQTKVDPFINESLGLVVATAHANARLVNRDGGRMHRHLMFSTEP